MTIFHGKWRRILCGKTNRNWLQTNLSDGAEKPRKKLIKKIKATKYSEQKKMIEKAIHDTIFIFQSMYFRCFWQFVVAIAKSSF